MNGRADVSWANGDSFGVMNRYKSLWWWSRSHDGPLLKKWERSAAAAAGYTGAQDVAGIWEVRLVTQSDYQKRSELAAMKKMVSWCVQIPLEPILIQVRASVRPVKISKTIHKIALILGTKL